METRGLPGGLPLFSVPAALQARKRERALVWRRCRAQGPHDRRVGHAPSGRPAAQRRVGCVRQTLRAHTAKRAGRSRRPRRPAGRASGWNTRPPAQPRRPPCTYHESGASVCPSERVHGGREKEAPACILYTTVFADPMAPYIRAAPYARSPVASVRIR